MSRENDGGLRGVYHRAAHRADPLASQPPFWLLRVLRRIDGRAHGVHHLRRRIANPMECQP